MCLRIGGVTVRFLPEDGMDFVGSLPERSEKFSEKRAVRVDLELLLRWGSTAISGGWCPSFDSGGVWRAFRDGRFDVLAFWTSGIPGNPFAVIRVDLPRRSGELILNRAILDAGESMLWLQYPLDEVLWVHILAQGLGAELHACGIRTPGGRGYLFVGQSGDGKSTTARIWSEIPGTEILSDDRIIVRRVDGRFVMYGTPWHGEVSFSSNAAVPLDGIFVLGHGSANRIEPVTVPHGAALLAARSFVPFHDSEALSFCLGFLGELATEVPCHTFAFVPDSSASGFVLEQDRRDSDCALVSHARTAGYWAPALARIE